MRDRVRPKMKLKGEFILDKNRILRGYLNNDPRLKLLKLQEYPYKISKFNYVIYEKVLDQRALF